MGKVHVNAYAYWHVDGEPKPFVDRIAAMKPDMIITFAYFGDYGRWGWGYPAGTQNLIPAVVDMMHDSDISYRVSS